jgi:type VI secretion system protein ImpA
VTYPTANGRRSLPDLETLLAPISDDALTGEYLRYEPIYDRIEELRFSEDPNLPQGVWERELAEADWDAVAAECTAALLAQSKDLQLAAWLTEAWVHRYGLRGLAHGLTLTTELCDRYWIWLYPPLEEDGSLDIRLRPVRWGMKQFPALIKTLPVTAPAPDAPAYCWIDKEQALRARTESEEDSDDAASRAGFAERVAATPTSFYETLAADLAEVRAALARLQAVTNELCSDEAPSGHALDGLLELMLAFARGQVNQRPPASDHGAEDSDMAPTDGGSTSGDGCANAALSAAFRTRAEAYALLARIADFLSHTEPHSPTPYLIRRAVKWGQMPLGTLLSDLIRDDSEVAAVYNLLGMEAGHNDD